MNKKELKLLIYNQLISIIESKTVTLNNAIVSAKEARDSDSKSSAGDKYETGRAMMHIEIEKNEVQLSKALKLKKELSEIDIKKDFQKIEFGSLVITNNGNYMISIGLGRLNIENVECYAISMASPIGKVIQNLKIGDSVLFQNREIIIQDIV